MGWAYAQGASNANAAGSSPIITYGSPVAAGDLMLLAAWCGTVPNIVSGVSDSVNGSWTQLAEVEVASYWRCYLYALANAAAGTPTVTITGNASAFGWGLAIAAYSGIATASPLDQIASTWGSDETSLTAGPTAAIQATDELVVGAAFWGGGSSQPTLTGGGGFTVRQNANNTGQNVGIALQDMSAASTAGQSAGFTLSAATAPSVCGIVAVFKVGGTPVALTGSLAALSAGSGTLGISLSGDA